MRLHLRMRTDDWSSQILVENCVQLYWVVGSPPVVVVSFVRALLTVAAMAMSRDWWMIVYYALFYPAWLTLEYFKKVGCVRWSQINNL